MENSRHMVEEVLALCLQKIMMEETSMSTDLELIQVVKNLEAARKQWLHAELELKKYKELLVKSDVSKAALEVKLKHARNQLDVEMRKRYKMEADFHYLQRQMQLMCDILVHDSKSSAWLNAEQKSLLATFEHKGNTTLQRSSKRLCVIDESSFLSHSDISYDRTDDDVDLDTTSIKPLRSRARERRRSSMGLPVGPQVGKRGRSGNVSAALLEMKPTEGPFQMSPAMSSSFSLGNQTRSILSSLFWVYHGVLLPVQMSRRILIDARTISAGPFDTRSSSWSAESLRLSLATRRRELSTDGKQNHDKGNPTMRNMFKFVQSIQTSTGWLIAMTTWETEVDFVTQEVHTFAKELLMTPETRINVVMGTAPETSEDPVYTPTQECGDQTSVWFPCDKTEAQMERAEKAVAHDFLSKTVIRPEMCLPCGKRMRFGKMAAKCRNCRAVAHPECKLKLSDRCLATATTGSSAQQNSLEDFAPVMNPKVPLLMVECVTEIERRGLEERGLYRVPGGERLVKELRERFIQGKTPLMLRKVHDVHVLCGLLKDFLRKLKEPLIPFRLHKTFMDASELPDEDNSTAIMYQAIAQLPKVNRDTLAFLMLHLQKVMRSPQCLMDKNNLARVFGPTIVGHGMSEPTPTTIMRDIHIQPKVISRMLSLPEAYWRRVLTVRTDKISSSTSKTHSLDDVHGRLFEPLTSPELSSFYKTPSRGTLSGRTRNQSNDLFRTGRAEPARRFFTSPT
ncbi:rac GTPase-activating protein 1 [Cyclopterus lumpus]|uniref:rac GTPase-activating protein 1 n=1 Tax=Cyclopterus lumpus TaxID=8103 RepID=UPI0014872EC5|nr:rac GTPase-activating protein 1 [Cyclopterus lumpus]